MRKTFYVSVAAIAVASGLFYLGSCTADYEEPGLSSLDIEDQIMRGKRLGPEIDDNSNSPYYIPVEEDECVLYVLTLLQGKAEKWNSRNKASDFYGDLKKYAVDSLGYKGGGMGSSMMFDLGQKFGLIGEQHVLGKSESAIQYFTGSNVGRIQTIVTANHVGMFISYDRLNERVHYQDYRGKMDCHISEVIAISYK